MIPRRVVVTGLGALTPIGNSVSAYWEGLISGTSGAAPITYFDPTDFKTQFACELKGFNALDHFDRKEARKQDRFTQYAMVSSDEAIKDAGLTDDNVDHDRVGVIWGAGIGGLETFQNEMLNFADNDRKPRFNPFFIPKLIADIAPGMISIKHGYRGPNFATTQKALRNDPMAINIMKELNIDSVELVKRARRAMHSILHDYAAFDVITLDSFTHRVIRSFAKDLGLSYNFNVALQVDVMLQETVDSLLNSVGEEEEITQILENFTYDKMEDEGTSWDIKQSLFLAAKLLLNENDRQEIKSIAGLSEQQKQQQHRFIVDKNKA
ncbi:hypothetical protein N9P98_04310, partial [Flavobacteriaceae bacterium]|nr:hypothetical protein [Flavobacteriaceae bacterium]